MDLNCKMIRAVRCGGYLGDLDAEEKYVLAAKRLADYVVTTDRWVLTKAGVAAAREIEAELTADELAEVDR